MANEQKNKSIGEVKIAADVVAAIAGLAATEVDGVYAMAGTLTNELAGSQQIETMTGLTVSEVNVRVSGVNLGNE